MRLSTAWSRRAIVSAPLEIGDRPTKEREAIELGVLVVFKDHLREGGIDDSGRLFADLLSKRESALLDWAER